MTPAQLRNHAEEMLTALVEDIEAEQSNSEQIRKSRGLGTQRGMAASGVLHADAHSTWLRSGGTDRGVPRASRVGPAIV